MRKAICFLLICLLAVVPALAKRPSETYALGELVNSGDTLAYRVTSTGLAADGCFDVVIKLNGRGVGQTVALEDFVLRAEDDREAMALYAQDAGSSGYRLKPGQTLTVPGDTAFVLCWRFPAIVDAGALRLVYTGAADAEQITELTGSSASSPDVAAADGSESDPKTEVQAESPADSVNRMQLTVKIGNSTEEIDLEAVNIYQTGKKHVRFVPSPGDMAVTNFGILWDYKEVIEYRQYLEIVYAKTGRNEKTIYQVTLSLPSNWQKGMHYRSTDSQNNVYGNPIFLIRDMQTGVEYSGTVPMYWELIIDESNADFTAGAGRFILRSEEKETEITASFSFRTPIGNAEEDAPYFDELPDVSSYVPQESYTPFYPENDTTSDADTETLCFSCRGTGRCQQCYGSGIDQKTPKYAGNTESQACYCEDGKCTVCGGTGRI